MRGRTITQGRQFTRVACHGGDEHVRPGGACASQRWRRRRSDLLFLGRHTHTHTQKPPDDGSRPPQDGDAPPTPPSPQSELQNPDPASQHPDPPSPDKDLSHVASPSLPVEHAQGDLGSKFCNPQHHQASNSPNPASLWIDEVPQQPEPAQRPSILADLVHDLESLLKGEKSDSLKTPSVQQSQDGWASSPTEGKEPPQASSKINGATTTLNAQPHPLASGGSSVLQHKGSRTEQPVRGERESPHKPAPTSRSSSRSDLGQDSEALKMDQNISTMKSTKAQQATPRQMAAPTDGKSPTRHCSKSNGATAPPPVQDPQTASTQNSLWTKTARSSKTDAEGESQRGIGDFGFYPILSNVHIQTAQINAVSQR